ncbi:MAG: REP-associated tyrosine transposase [Acidobacteriota bacterium]
MAGRGCGDEMARPLRIEYPGAVYHVSSRGNARQRVFLGDVDRVAFLEAVASGVARYGFIIHAYCLMDNHYHLLVETPNANLSLGMQRINGEYTQGFNRRHRRCGHLFQGRFKAVLVQKESHLLEVCRYVVLNPVRAKMVKRVGEWAWSSYKATAGEVKCPPYLSTSWVLSQFHREKAIAQRLYRRYVAQGLREKESPFARVAAQMVLGTAEFVDEWREKAQAKREVQEHPRFQRMAARPALEKIVSRESVGGRVGLAKQVRDAHVVHGYTLAEIAKHLGVHYATAGRLLKLAMNDAK